MTLRMKILKMTTNDDEFIELVQRIAGGDLLNQPIDLNLKEFKRFYELFIEMNDRKVPWITAIHLGDQVQLIFPEHSRQEIIIEPENKHKIYREDFSFIPIVDWKGAKKPATGFGRFLREEIRISKARISLIFLLSFSILFISFPTLEVLDLINSLLIQASTVFLSIYLIFTVSQSERLSSDRKLFEKGILHKYYSDDKHITIFAILTIALAFINTIIVHLSWFDQQNSSYLNDLGRWIIAITTSIVATMLFHTFFIVGDYYLDRTRDIAERQHVGNIFHEEYVKKNIKRE